MEDKVVVLKREEIPVRGRSAKERLFGHFRKLSRDKGLKLELSDFKLTLSGFRYIIREWNDNETEKLAYTRKNGTIYIYTVQEPQEKKNR